MDSRSLLRGLVDQIPPLLPADLRGFRTGSGWGLVKIFYGNQGLHYEANHRPKANTIEIGLHFEADRLTNARLLGAFRIHERRIHRELPGARLEEWDKGWARIWEPVTYEELDAALQRDLAERLARYITTLEPILRQELPADVEWKLPAKPRRSDPAPEDGRRRSSDDRVTRTRSSGRRR